MATATRTNRTRRTNANEEAKRPIHQERLGRIVAAIWKNETAVGTRHNVTVSRIYTDEKGEWQRSSSFGRDDLPLVAKVLDRAHSWIFEQFSEAPEESSEQEADAHLERHGDVPY